MWLREQFRGQEHAEEKWRQFLHSLNTPPPSAFTPSRREHTAKAYRRLRAAEPPRAIRAKK